MLRILKKVQKLNEVIEEFNQKYQIDVLKMEITVNMKNVEGYNGDNLVVYTNEEVLKQFKD